MQKQKRISANFVRKFLPSLRRINTAEGRRWTVDGKKTYITLQEVIEAYSKNHKATDAEEANEKKLVDMLNQGAVKEVAADA